MTKQYAFILGHNPELSLEEIQAVLPKAKLVDQAKTFAVFDVNQELDAFELMNKLGGTVKVAEVINDKIDQDQLVEFLKSKAGSSKLNFGVSYYNLPTDNLGMQLKGKLKQQEISCRLVVSKEPILSSVVVTKNKVNEVLLLGRKFVATTLAVQDFEEYGEFDYGRPSRDMVSGSMPPKLAKIMLNLSGAKVDQVIIDPFCGSGTMIQQALILGFSDIIGSDASPKAVEDTNKNLQWLKSKIKFQSEKVKVIQCDARQLAKRLKNTEVDVVVTEPYLGPPLKGNEPPVRIEQIVKELSSLYVDSFKSFVKLLKTQGRVVIVFPVIIKKDKEYPLPIVEQIEKLGFKEISESKLRFSRPGQKVERQIMIFDKK
jgi:tRNA G10  N-methylase Trm11